MPYVPFYYGEKPLPSAKLNNNFAGKADLDPNTGKVVSAQLPDLAAIAHQALDAPIAAATTAATAASSDAKAATTAAATASTAASSAHDLAAAAIPLTQRAANNGVATLDSDGKVPLAQLPPLSGGPALTPPVVSDFPIWVNQGASITTDTSNGLLFVPGLLGSSNGNNITGGFRSLPSGDFDIEIIITKGGLDWPFVAAGIALRETATGKFFTALAGRVYYDDPAFSSLTGDTSGVTFSQWSDSHTISAQRGIPCGTGEVHYRITRTGSTLTLRVRRGLSLPWVGVWGVTPDPATYDSIGFACNPNSYGGFTNWPEQPFVIRHYGTVLA